MKEADSKVGQLVQYMDMSRAQYGFCSTYESTWILKRVSSREFVESPSISYQCVSTREQPSVKECFLFLALVAADLEAAYWPETTGKTQVSSVMIHFMSPTKLLIDVWKESGPDWMEEEKD